MDERTLLDKARKQEPHAWTWLVGKYGPDVYNLVARFAPKSEIDDLYQEVFTKVYLKIRSYDPKRPFRPWLMRVAVNTALNYCRRLKLICPLPKDLPERHTVLSWETAEEIREILSHFLPKVRMVFLLYHYYGYHTKEIASMTKMPPGTVKSHLRRAHIKLDQWLSVRGEKK